MVKFGLSWSKVMSGEKAEHLQPGNEDLRTWWNWALSLKSLSSKFAFPYVSRLRETLRRCIWRAPLTACKFATLLLYSSVAVASALLPDSCQYLLAFWFSRKTLLNCDQFWKLRDIPKFLVWVILPLKSFPFLLFCAGPSMRHNSITPARSSLWTLSLG